MPDVKYKNPTVAFFLSHDGKQSQKMRGFELMSKLAIQGGNSIKQYDANKPKCWGFKVLVSTHSNAIAHNFED
ncbi:hypothetical protein P4O66_012491 [Electrophorus voltai]|uniref:Uncharacterized protein n=1 Tax=Electrophorus voltai TaxID=2609070 RepID=A0AAD8Z421_9TELE|nr:hypothetical protein P4O66_012491 [Electrophorus voltai]